MKHSKHRFLQCTATAKALLTILALTTIATRVMGDDAEIKKQLLGRWKDEVDYTVIRDDGTWDVRNGVLIHHINPYRDDEFKIISLTKSKLVIQDMHHGHGTATWTRD
jgi:hypothetical protein